MRVAEQQVAHPVPRGVQVHAFQVQFQPSEVHPQLQAGGFHPHLIADVPQREVMHTESPSGRGIGGRGLHGVASGEALHDEVEVEGAVRMLHQVCMDALQPHALQLDLPSQQSGHAQPGADQSGGEQGIARGIGHAQVAQGQAHRKAQGDAAQMHVGPGPFLHEGHDLVPQQGLHRWQVQGHADKHEQGHQGDQHPRDHPNGPAQDPEHRPPFGGSGFGLVHRDVENSPLQAGPEFSPGTRPRAAAWRAVALPPASRAGRVRWCCTGR